MNTNQLTGITLLLTLLTGVLLLPTAPVPTDQDSNKLTQQERYEQTCIQEDGGTGSMTASNAGQDTAGEAPRPTMVFTDISCNLTASTATIRFTLNNTHQFIPSLGPLHATTAAKPYHRSPPGFPGFNARITPTALQRLPESASIYDTPHPEQAALTLVNTTGTLQCPGNTVTLKFSAPRPNTSAIYIDLRYGEPGEQLFSGAEFTCTGNTTITDLSQHPRPIS